MMTGLRMSGDCVIVIAWAAQFSSSRGRTDIDKTDISRRTINRQLINRQTINRPVK